MTLIGLNQHRLQPWAYELGIVAVVWLGIRSDTRRLAWMRWLIVSIYCYSALGKFDFEFLHTVGQQMLTALLKLGGIDSRQLSEPVRVAIAATFPVYELLIAVGLAFPRTRRLAGIAAIILHAVLIVILGPLGLNHRTGVLVWNVQVAVQTYWMFVAGRTRTGNTQEQAVAQRKAQPSEQSDAPELDSTYATAFLRERACAAVLLAVMVLPASERLGLWDHWPSWALYAPHSSRVRVEALPMIVAKLPSSLRAVVAIDRQNGGENMPEDFSWVSLPLEAWSLKTLDSPIYPQARFQLGVAATISKSLDSEFGIRVTVLGPAARLDGERSEFLLDSRSAILNSGSKFWVNTENRPLFERNLRNGSGTVP
jgi:hypothetical protein